MFLFNIVVLNVPLPPPPNYNIDLDDLSCYDPNNPGILYETVTSTPAYFSFVRKNGKLGVEVTGNKYIDFSPNYEIYDVNLSLNLQYGQGLTFEQYTPLRDAIYNPDGFTQEFVFFVREDTPYYQRLIHTDDWHRHFVGVKLDGCALDVGYTDNTDDLYVNWNILPNEWHHLVVVWKLETVARIYLDGQLIGSKVPTLSAYSSIGGSSGGVNLGRGHETPFEALLKGGIALFRQYNTVLSSEQIAQLYVNSASKRSITIDNSNNLTLVNTDLKIHIDAGRLGTGVLDGSNTLNTIKNLAGTETWSYSLYNQRTVGSMWFNGSSALDFGNLTELYNSRNTEFTEEFVFSVKELASGKSQSTLIRVDDWARYTVAVSSTQIIFVVGYGDSDYLAYNFSRGFNEWYHVAVVWKKQNKQEIYLNGELVASRTPTLAAFLYDTLYSGGANLGRGHTSPYHQPLIGNIAVFRHYNKVKSGADILNNYNYYERNGYKGFASPS